MWRCSARARRSGSALSWNSETASRPTTLSATCSLDWTRTASRNALWNGARRWRTCCPERWWPSTARRCAALTTKGRARKAIHLVSAWASANTLTLGQVMTGEKSNEITAIPRLLEMLELKGCIVTIDAMGCQKEIAQGILDREADYLLAVKENQGRLYGDIRDLFEGAEEAGFDGVPHDYATTLNKGHGRIERRECWVIRDPVCLGYLSTGKEWPGLRSVVKVVGRRETEKGNTAHARYYISSLEVPAGQSLSASRAHWSIENSLHWSLDVTFREDQSRMRKDHSPQNMATLRQIAHNQLKRETSLKVGIQGKRLQAGWRDDYLLKVLRS